jgi:hypothetical protein
MLNVICPQDLIPGITPGGPGGGSPPSAPQQTQLSTARIRAIGQTYETYGTSDCSSLGQFIVDIANESANQLQVIDALNMVFPDNGPTFTIGLPDMPGNAQIAIPYPGGTKNYLKFGGNGKAGYSSQYLNDDGSPEDDQS